MKIWSMGSSTVWFKRPLWKVKQLSSARTFTKYYTPILGVLFRLSVQFSRHGSKLTALIANWLTEKLIYIYCSIFSSFFPLACLIELFPRYPFPVLERQPEIRLSKARTQRLLWKCWQLWRERISKLTRRKRLPFRSWDLQHLVILRNFVSNSICDMRSNSLRIKTGDENMHIEEILWGYISHVP